MDFWVLGSKFVKFLMLVLNWHVNSSPNFASFFIIITHNSPVKFKLIHFLLWIKESQQGGGPILRLLSALVKICQIPHVIFESPSQFSSKFWTNILCHQTWLFCTFLAQTLYTLVKSSPIKFKFSRFLTGRVKFLRSILTWLVDSPASFGSFFIVMTHNSPVNFKLCIKGSHQSPNFETFEYSGENFPNSSCHFPKHKSVFLQLLHYSRMSWKMKRFSTFLAQTLYTLVSPLKCNFFVFPFLMTMKRVRRKFFSI